MEKFTLKKLIIFFMLLFTSMTVFSQNFGEFIVNSHISDANMQILYKNCDSLNINPVFHYFYSDDELMNDDAKIRKGQISPNYMPCGSINGIQLVTNLSYTQDYLWDINKWIPLLLNEEPIISFYASSYLEYLNPQEVEFHFDIINIQNIETGDIVLFALVEDVGNKRNVQRKMLPSASGIEYVSQKTISVSSFWPKEAILERCSVVVWIEKPDKTVVYSKEFPVVNEYVDQEPNLNYQLTCPNAVGEPTILNWWYLDLSSSTDYEDDIYGKTMQASVQWEEAGEWYPYALITNEFKYRYRVAGTYTITFKLIDSYGNVVTGSEEVKVGWLTGVENIFNEESIKIYPNPFIETINIRANDLMKNIHVYDIVGQEIFVHNDINSPDYKLNTNRFFSGTYFIIIEYADSKLKNTTYKVIKN